MLLNTKHFGQLEIEEEKIIHFSQGLLAFEDVEKFVVIENEDKDIPFAWLQAVDDPELAFVIINPFLFKKDYEFDLSQDVKDELELTDPQDIVLYTLVVIPEDYRQMTANLLAPLVINTKSQKGRQVILHDTPYTTKHYILKELAQASPGGV